MCKDPCNEKSVHETPEAYLFTRILVFHVLIFWPDFAGSTAPDQLQPGIVVERVLKGSEAEKAGLREGDVLLGWTQGSASGSFIFPFDLNTSRRNRDLAEG
jgi:hypothetical protein